MKIEIPLYDNLFDDFRHETISVEIADIAPHLARVATFAVGRIPEYEYRNGNDWRMYFVECGSSVAQRRCDAPTKRECIKRARQLLAGKSARITLMAIKQLPEDARK